MKVAIKQAALSRVGVAIVSRWTVGTELEAGLLGLAPLSNLKIRRPLHRKKLRERSKSLPTRAFLMFLG